jgi:hypothetical protein
LQPEVAIEEKLNNLIPFVSEHVGTVTLFTEFKSLPREHRQALETRLNAIVDSAHPIVKFGFRFPIDELTGQSYNAVSTALQMVYQKSCFKAPAFRYGDEKPPAKAD